MVTGRIEFVPTNTRAPHMIVLEGDGARLSFACTTREVAERKLPTLVKAWNEASIKAEIEIKAWTTVDLTNPAIELEIFVPELGRSHVVRCHYGDGGIDDAKRECLAGAQDWADFAVKRHRSKAA